MHTHGERATLRVAKALSQQGRQLAAGSARQGVMAMLEGNTGQARQLLNQAKQAGAQEWTKPADTRHVKHEN